MTSGTRSLNSQDIAILARYVERNERAGYWTYLRDLGDPYAALALQVVNNGTFDGVIANRYAHDVAAAGGDNLTPERWEKVGRDLINADLSARSALVDKGQGTAALYLDVDSIKPEHQTAFGANGLTLDAWTAWSPGFVCQW